MLSNFRHGMMRVRAFEAGKLGLLALVLVCSLALTGCGLANLVAGSGGGKGKKSASAPASQRAAIKPAAELASKPGSRQEPAMERRKALRKEKEARKTGEEKESTGGRSATKKETLSPGSRPSKAAPAESRQPDDPKDSAKQTGQSTDQTSDAKGKKAIPPEDTPPEAAKSGKGKGGVVSLNWATGDEVEVQGFNVMRAESPRGPFRPANSAIIPGAGTSTGEHSYKFADEGVKPGQQYYYYLEQVLFSGEKQRLSSTLPYTAGKKDQP